MKNPKECMLMVSEHLEAQSQSEAWQGSMYQPMAYIFTMGGKRIRPLLLLLSYQAVTGRSPEEAIGPAVAVEMFHNFTLMHDDIMDNAPVRRGLRTVHEKWDSNTAILAGDALFAVAMSKTVEGFPQKAAPLIQEFSRIAVGVCEGQMEDMEMAGRIDSTVGEYIEMIRKKTAMLLGGSMSLGGIAAGATDEDVESLYKYGEWMGIGFQLHDDYLDVYADASKFGKQVGGDILENKMTFLLIKALELANPEQKAELNRLLFSEKDPQAKVAGVMALYEALEIPRLTRELADEYFQKARKVGERLSKFEGFRYIEEFLKALTEREY